MYVYIYIYIERERENIYLHHIMLFVVCYTICSVSVNTNSPFLLARAPQSSGRNCNPAPDLVI